LNKTGIIDGTTRPKRAYIIISTGLVLTIPVTANSKSWVLPIWNARSKKYEANFEIMTLCQQTKKNCNGYAQYRQMGVLNDGKRQRIP
jgi:hypothetical protein